MRGTERVPYPGQAGDSRVISRRAGTAAYERRLGLKSGANLAAR